MPAFLPFSLSTQNKPVAYQKLGTIKLKKTVLFLGFLAALEMTIEVGNDNGSPK